MEEQGRGGSDVALQMSGGCVGVNFILVYVRLAGKGGRGRKDQKRERIIKNCVCMLCAGMGRDDGKHDSGLEVVATTQCTRSRRRADDDDTRGIEEITKANKTTDTHLNSIFDGVCSPELISPTLAAYALT
jgi:hypothetical protein